MINFVSITGAMLGAATVAGGLLLVIGMAMGNVRAASFAAALGVALGLGLGWWWIEARPHWPPTAGLDRLLLLVLPAAAFVELTATLGASRWLSRALRVIVSASAARVLLDGSRYVTDWAGPGTRDWSETESFVRCAGLGAMLAAGWLGMTELAHRSPRRGHVLSLALCCAVAGPVILLSAYKTGGEMAFPLTAALLGAAIGSLALPSGSATLEGAIGVGVVALYGILFLGVFFVSLLPLHAAILFCAPLACWIPEIPFVRRRGPWWRSALRVVLVGGPAAFVLWRVLPQTKPNAEPRPNETAPSIDHYRNHK